MKKATLSILIIVMLFGALIVCCNVGNGQFDYADEVEWQPSPAGDGITWRVGERPVYMYSITANNKPVGARLYGLYFGASRIEVIADVYSTDTLVIDFMVNSTNLTQEQQQTRNTLIALFSNISQMIDDVDDCANTNYDGSKQFGYITSDIYRYNVAKQGETVDVTRYTYDMLTYARKMYLATDGAFNPAVYRIVDLWGFSSRLYTYGRYGEQPYDRDTYKLLPEQKYIDAFSNPSFTDFTDKAVKLNDNGDGTYSVTKNVSPAVVDGVEFQQWLDLGGIAKGYAVDKAREMIRQLGVDRFYVNAGSSSIATGYEYDGGDTVMNITDAFDPLSAIFPSSLCSVKIGKSSVSTSGQNIRHYTVDGVEYAHIIDGVTGAPAQTGVKSVTVVVPEESGAYWSTMGDCLTTALTVMGRDKIVDFANGYLKENGIKFLVQYQTLDGKKQILSNYGEDDVKPVADSYPEFGWALKADGDGNFYYDADTKFYNPKQTYTVILAVSGSVLGAGVVALIVYHFLRGKRRTTSNVANAKKDKPFKPLDVMAYIGVALVILVLFYVFVLDTDTAQLQTVTVIDIETGETLIMYNVTRNEYTINSDNVNGWQVEVVTVNDGVEVTLSRQIDGEEHFNTLHVTRGLTPSVEMVNSLCGFHQDCVRNFRAITRSGGSIVCSPNSLKVITQ